MHRRVGYALLCEAVQIVVHDLEGDDRFDCVLAVYAGCKRGEGRGDLGIEALVTQPGERERLQSWIVDRACLVLPSAELDADEGCDSQPVAGICERKGKARSRHHPAVGECSL